MMMAGYKTEYHQESLYLFFKTSCVWFYPRSLGYLLLVLGYPSSGGYRLFLMEWTLRQIRHLLATPTSFMAYCPNIFCSQDRLQVKDFVIGLVFKFLLQQLTEHLPSQRDWNVGTSSKSSYSMSVCILSSAMGPCSQLARSNPQSQHQPGLFGLSMGILGQQLNILY